MVSDAGAAVATAAGRAVGASGWGCRLRRSTYATSVTAGGHSARTTAINFHWATIQLPPTLVDYVIVHELAHVHEPNHTPEFWLRVERALPTFQRAKLDLARVGARLWLGDALPVSAPERDEVRTP